MEILFISHKFPPAIGGMEKQSFELINGMSSLTPVHQIVYQGNESILRFFFLLNKRILALLDKHPDIRLIHFNDGLVASLSLRHRGYDHLKKVVTIHGLDVVFPLRHFQKKIIPEFNRFDKIIAVSQATKQAAIDRGIDPNKIDVIANGVDHHLVMDPHVAIDVILKKYKIDQNGNKLIIALGRPVKRKGISWFIKHVLPQLPADYKLILIGPFTRTETWKEKLLYALPHPVRHLVFLFLGFPSDQKVIRQYLRNPDYQDRLQHIGKIPLVDVQSLLCHSGLFIMPNIKVDGDMEGFGLVSLEASICGATVFASDLEGISDAIVHQKNGFLLPTGEADRWISEIKDALDDPLLLQNRSKEFQAYSLQHYSWEKMSKAYFALFQHIIQCG
ncbi:glycosyltransferase family 4 protein [Sphingobacterium faecium]|uniref:glycosyltransferase family 4 protein n=1 Tax=Sphingobacterium faecium TaxID=34087 RepID=UPI003207E50A